MVSAPTDGWQTFDDPRFELRFRYPDPTPEGRAVRAIERAHGSAGGVHLLSDGRELYVELMRLPAMPPTEEYAAHREALEKRFGAESVSKLGSTYLAGQPARTYSFRWPEGERVAVLLATASATYRVIYNSASPLNARVVATFELRRG
jgi:hypothetical protein